ncbi:pimeloyl-ACP methyl ester carboxylesterase [Agromyces flavus]|uniref:Pimeloyl-ACP methyl ester carboxylesterase n=1 Tax=Agromyces flavus TaxID=589382 RepID=A0A1H1RA55_9MICO|nr:alpha/beta hydrolase [Agromyces flavus]MCP2367593.1 pimeloyl-ACP methyl ester carboxylesterase [Agromyces flavus]GGI47007.1 alpha/beta hydrolase [Agromyces flavus]SDS32386.1 Pimeloyl-ACP methyl ester carboxylesterase [Agromyces flavus]
MSERTLETSEHDECVAGRQYRVHVSGRSSTDGAATILLVHGIGMTHASLDPVQHRLPAGIRCLNVDLAGFGSTERPRRAVPIEEYAADLAEVVDRLDAWPIVATGHSMGTQVVLELARLRPKGVRTLVMVGPVVDDARRTVPRQAVDLARDTFGEPLPVNALVLRDYVRGGIRWYVAVLREMMRYPTLERMRECPVPAIVVRGRHDPIARADWCVRLVEAAPGEARLLTVQGDHHVVPWTSPEWLAAELATLARGSDVGGY